MMFFWFTLMLLLILCAIACLYYLGRGFSRFHFIQKLSKYQQKRARLIGICISTAFFAISSLLFNFMNGIIILLHLMVFWFFFNTAAKILRRSQPQQLSADDSLIKAQSSYPSGKSGPYFAGIFAIITTILYLSIGAYLAIHVFETNYTIETDKKVTPLRIAHIADSHIGTTFDGEGFARHLERIQNTNPDALMITGDFIDDDSKREDIIRACEALGSFRSTYGVFYSFGNHDKGYYNSRNFTGDELIAELEKNNVRVLQDETYELSEDYLIIGRQDRSENSHGISRASMEELTRDIDSDKFSIVLDHQPHDYQEEQDANVDLVLSGHTHGGQLIPINYIGEWSGANAKTYGLEKKGNTTFIVTSGISDWALLFKTGCKSEFVIIDIKSE